MYESICYVSVSRQSIGESVIDGGGRGSSGGNGNGYGYGCGDNGGGSGLCGSDGDRRQRRNNTDDDGQSKLLSTLSTVLTLRLTGTLKHRVAPALIPMKTTLLDTFVINDPRVPVKVLL
ncbi:hypothetical protein K449DRAFT_426595 [Hypoxylon sp. EC38]|nr:hypothetical protein K449DRAFT_426595 [Hypoxylon sp. EC38]